ncbi:hypothetical protein CGCSCA4_v000997 [Colletotrichum siamense]|uniref:Extracellular membrane protein CFEM domain-containing protein n=2 Tax=Colletotrichum gloeosporioides species complex TaxID=2707338 RepID=L2G319_COLFN|nr:uncharacterized protein CGMCC3_g12050 [Colletotrichum fructicola]KAF4477646.1 hypothetical protein CGGC5_v013256 [Colletotrichum fructicola Nara gc5]KAF4856121.1 hypothetical protein CGCSCA4_v000997 [Colletotrichum siamense]KAI8242036.1 hypothetical protein K4K55_011382 [Colletotrichum sp. SAR 10_96]KAI8256537.1 hypothetical protein K4K53_007056 [Colletotrichum sp. SAR 10_77]KAI8289937.1 hypothetical protein K4K60_007406 [Colletotrichum sp. SAR11_57]KAJ5004020.1 hypothetical protein K4K48_
MAPSRSKALSLLSILLLSTPIFAKVQNDFSYYPSAAQPCLYSASDSSQCDGDTVAEMNKCLCSDSKGKFITNTAKCLGKDAKGSVSETYSDLKTSCANSNTPISITEDQFNNLAAQGATATSIPVTPSSTSAPKTSKTASPTTFMTTTTGGATVTVTTTPTPTDATSTPTAAASGLSTTAKIGIGVGGGVGAVAIVGIIAFVWRLKKSRSAHEESRPMLDGGVGATGYNPHNSPSASAAAFGLENPNDYKTETKTGGWRPTTDIPPSASPGAQTWATNSPQPPYAPYSPPPPQQQQQMHAWGHHPQAAYPPGPQVAPQPGVFELASIPVQPSYPQPPPDAVEMPATEVQPQPARYQYPSQR